MDAHDIESALAALGDGLRQACSYQRGDDNSPDKDEVHGGRLAAIKALDAVLDFLNHIPMVKNERLHIPLENLKHALLDYEIGLDPALFDREIWTGGGRKPEPSDWKAVRAAAAVAMDLYMQSGIDREKAAARVALYLDQKGYTMPGRDPHITGKTVANWRDHAKTGLPTEDPDADLYRHCALLLLADGAPESAAGRILEWARFRFPPS